MFVAFYMHSSPTTQTPVSSIKTPRLYNIHNHKPNWCGALIPELQSNSFMAFIHSHFRFRFQTRSQFTIIFCIRRRNKAAAAAAGKILAISFSPSFRLCVWFFFHIENKWKRRKRRRRRIRKRGKKHEKHIFSLCLSFVSFWIVASLHDCEICSVIGYGSCGDACWNYNDQINQCNLQAFWS